MPEEEEDNKPNEQPSKESEEETCEKETTETNDDNVVRKISKFLVKTLNLKHAWVGLIYMFLHHLIIFLVGFVTLFNNNIVHLVAVLVIVSLDALSIIALHECPLTLMEQKYLGISGCQQRTFCLRNAGIVYKCEHEYEKQVELLINAWTIIACKCLIVSFLETFNFKLHNYGSLYQL